MQINSIYKVSVIVPVYNVEQYLSACLESICHQTLKEIEIIVVNDGSTDNSLSIIKSFQQKYSNIKLINKKNGGLSSARNAGIKVATAPYLCFIDSDDFIDLDAIEKMYKKAECTHAPLIICNMMLYWSDEKKRNYKDWNIKPHGEYDKNELYNMLLTGCMGCQCRNKLYDRNIWIENSLSFQEGKYYEDIEMAFKIIQVYQRAYIINETLYKYRMRPGSIVATPNIKKIKDFVANTTLAISIVTDDLHHIVNKSVEQFKMNSLVYAFELLHKLGGNKELKKYINENISLSSCFFALMVKDTIPVKIKIKYLLYVRLYSLIK